MSELISEAPESPISPTPEEVEVDRVTSESPSSPPPNPRDDLDENSGTSESPTSPPPPKVPLHNNYSSDIGSDIVLWRRKQLNISILAAATAIWVMMDVYNYNFITLLSWVAIAILSCLFFWGSIHTILKKEAPDLSELEISEESATEQAKLLRQRAEDGIRLVFHVGAEREWFVFAGAVVSLYLTSLLAKRVDFVTLCYIGIVGAMSVPAVYVKHEQRIREFGDKMKIQEFGDNVRTRAQRLKMMMEERLQKMKNRIGAKSKVVKEKKTK